MIQLGTSESYPIDHGEPGIIHCAFDGCDDRGPRYLIGCQFFCSSHAAVFLCEEEVESCETL